MCGKLIWRCSVRVGDLVRHTAGKQLGAGLVTQVGESDLVTVFWSSSGGRPLWWRRSYLEVLSESR